MRSRNINTIALVDWSWTGHHPTYFAHFASAIAEIGLNVVPLCPSPEAFERQLLTTPIAPRLRLTPKIFPAARFNLAPEWNIRPYRFRPILQALHHFGGLGKRLRKWERKNDHKIDLVFFACIYDRHFEWFKYAERAFGFPWSGLYLHARAFRMPGTPVPYFGGLPCPEKIFTARSMHSVGLLDEGSVESMRRLVGNKPAIVFPDLCDSQIPSTGEPEKGLADKLRCFAGDRPIVSLVGHLQRTKGLYEFTKLSRHESMRNVFFFLGGEVNWAEISDTTRLEMLKSWEQAPNFFAHLSHLSEPAINAVIQSSDVVFAAYTDFPNSSNILNKAAHFDRPVIVSDGYLMAERTRTYRLGEVVAERDVEAMVAAIQKITSVEYPTSRKDHCRREEYLQQHSYDRLVQSFKELCSIE